jgi:hypothetical protein
LWNFSPLPLWSVSVLARSSHDTTKRKKELKSRNLLSKRMQTDHDAGFEGIPFANRVLLVLNMIIDHQNIFLTSITITNRFN